MLANKFSEDVAGNCLADSGNIKNADQDSVVFWQGTVVKQVGRIGFIVEIASISVN